ELQMSLLPYAAQLELLICVPLVLLLRILFRRSGYNLAELSVFALFVMGQIALVDGIIDAALLAAHGPARVIKAVVFVVAPLLVVQAAIGFFGGRLRTAFKAAFAVLTAYVVYGLAQWAVLITYVMRTR